jgi:hypothetical protein
MKQPSPITSILASGPVFFGSWVFACWLLYQWSLDGGIWPLIVVMGGFLLAVMKADERLKAYKAWKREWDAMDGQPTGLAPGMKTGIWLGIAGIVGCFVLAGQPPETQNAVVVLGLLPSPNSGASCQICWLRRQPIALKPDVFTVTSKPPIPLPQRRRSEAPPMPSPPNRCAATPTRHALLPLRSATLPRPPGASSTNDAHFMWPSSRYWPAPPTIRMDSTCGAAAPPSSCATGG